MLCVKAFVQLRAVAAALAVRGKLRRVVPERVLVLATERGAGDALQLAAQVHFGPQPSLGEQKRAPDHLDCNAAEAEGSRDRKLLE